MKWNHKSFAARLWLYFVLFAALIAAALWLLQTVCLQYFYNGMVIQNVKKAADQIAAQQDAAALDSLLDQLAYENSLLIFLTDSQGRLLYGTDEHSHVYQRDTARGGSGGDNPYRNSAEIQSWQIGVGRNLTLPQDYGVFLEKLRESTDGTVGYQLENASAYVYGRELPALGDGAVLYISSSLEAVGATVGILRTQLLWVTAASLVLAFAMAYFLARRFSRPVSALSQQARSMARGHFSSRSYEKGFCTELDALADSLNQASDALEKTESIRRELLANISHDLRTPLTMIRGYAEMVRDISWEDEAQRETDLSVIIRETDRLTELVNDILDYTALQSDGRPKDTETFDLGAAAREVLEQFRPLCACQGYTLDAQTEPGLLVHGSRQQLSRVLYNLLDNALTHAGEPRRVQMLLRDTGSHVRAEVRDFGEGIAPEDLPYIWERYFTLKQSRRSENSSGLGLAISKEILQAHQARFGADSVPGQGSAFWFELPKASGDSAP